METTRVVVCFFSWLIWRMAWKTGETVKLDHLLKDFGLSTEVSQGSWLLIEEIRLTSLIGSCSHYLQDLKRFYYVSGGEPQISKTIINSRKPDRNLDILHINYWWTPDFWSINRTQMIKRFVTGVKHTHTHNANRKLKHPSNHQTSIIGRLLGPYPDRSGHTLSGSMYGMFRAADSHLEYSKKIVRSSDTLRISKSLAVRIFPPSQNHSHLEYFFEKCKKPSVFNHNWGKTLALRILKKNILILT